MERNERNSVRRAILANDKKNESIHPVALRACHAFLKSVCVGRGETIDPMQIWPPLYYSFVRI